ncbi:MAG: NAD-dependent epimerase/dehydratase family protein, partial [Actinocrinis sp.]
MSSPAAGGRRRSARLTVAVTGAADVIGAAVAVRLAGHEDVRKAIALDPQPVDLPGVTYRKADTRDPGLAEKFADVDVVIHADIDTSPDTDATVRTAWNVRGTQTVLTAAAAAGVSRVVLFTSAVVYGAYPDNPVPLDEDAPLRAVPDGSLVGDYLEIERLAERAPKAHPGLAVTVLRPTVLTGPGVDTVFTRHFEAPRLLVVKDTEPCWQFCHVEDLASGLVQAALGDVDGPLTVGSDGWLGQKEVEEISGMRRMELPESLALGAAERLHRLHLTPAPATDLQYVMHPWAVSTSRLKATGWQPEFGNAEAFQALLVEIEGHHAALARRLGKKDA